MHGTGTFQDTRLGINAVRTPDRVTPVLDALRQYQFSLATPEAPGGSINSAAAIRGRDVFNGSGAA